MKKYYFSAKSIEDLSALLKNVFEDFKGKTVAISLWISEKDNDEVEYKIKRYMDENFCEITSIKEIAEKFSYHPDTITRKFKKKFGITPYKYLLQLKMEYAMHLLNEGYLIKQIADVVGFSSSNYFAQKLRKYVNRNKSRK